MIIFKEMIFRPSLLIKIVVLFSFGIGIVIFFAGIYLYNLAENLQLLGALMLLGTPWLFLFFGFVSLMSFKTIQRKEGEWIISYKFRKKVIHLNQDTILEISFQKKVSIAKACSFTKTLATRGWGEQMSVKTEKGQDITIRAFEIKAYSKLSALLAKDFETNRIIKE